MNIFNQFKEELNLLLQELSTQSILPDDLDARNITVEPPRDEKHGDIATNAALVLSKQARMKPRDLAECLVGPLTALEHVESVEIAGPGFINLRLSPNYLVAIVLDAIADPNGEYGSSNIGDGEKINVEYVSANPTGPMHVGHCRGAVFGDALASLLAKVGYAVTREYYINDAGAQIDVLARSAYLRYREALGEEVGDIPEGLYPGEYLVSVGEKLARLYGDKWLKAPEAEWLTVIRDFAAAEMMDMIRDDLASLGISFDLFYSEKTLHDSGRIADALAQLDAKGLIYEGVLEPPKGKLPDDWEARPQTLFKSTQFGDDVDRAVKKSDGSWTYFAADVAYHLDKYQRGFSRMVDVWGADHGGYIKRVQAAVTALTDGEGDLDVKLCQLVRLFRNGEPVRMSKRAGNFVTLRDVVDEVGKDVVRFIMLSRKNDATLDFDFSKVTEQSKDNPVFYVQYAHARICSVRDKAAEQLPEIDETDEEDIDLSLIQDPAEIRLIKTLANWPRIIESAAMAHEPHRVAFYLYDLASDFHALWNKGNDNPELRFIIDNNVALTRARLVMILAVRWVIASGLEILGVEPAEAM
ncbi:MAG: arginine--tRNA ligase [Kordiimonas sp.]|nr:arginine--tRNA ligase [Kordiimonas sp.]|tara:strand:+ start:306 stop:2054 length:1749 start_codon:yes stop_codon:yes gene_type:complete